MTKKPLKAAYKNDEMIVIMSPTAFKVAKDNLPGDFGLGHQIIVKAEVCNKLTWNWFSALLEVKS